MHIIGDIMGIPEADRPRRVPLDRHDHVGTRSGDRASSDRAPRSPGCDLYEYAEQLGDDKRRNPTDDVWSILTTAEVEDDDGDA